MTTEKAWEIIKNLAFPNKNVPLSTEEKMALNRMEWLVYVGTKKLEEKEK